MTEEILPLQIFLDMFSISMEEMEPQIDALTELYKVDYINLRAQNFFCQNLFICQKS